MKKRLLILIICLLLLILGGDYMLRRDKQPPPVKGYAEIEYISDETLVKIQACADEIEKQAEKIKTIIGKR